MERAGDSDRTTLAVTCDGDAPAYSSGSSCATATFAGMAALVWSKKGLTTPRWQVVSTLINAASNKSNIHPNFGYGWVDMDTALSL